MNRYNRYECEFCGRRFREEICPGRGAPRARLGTVLFSDPGPQRADMLSTKPHTGLPVIMGRGPIVPMDALDMKIKAADVRKRIEELEAGEA